MGGGLLRRNRDVSLLVTGSTVNNVGDWLIELALPLYVFTETGSGIATAAVYLVSMVVGTVFGPLGGRLVDGWPLRSTLVGSNVAQMVALAPLLFVTPDRIWPIFIVVVLQGLIRSVNDPASFALLPRLVDDEELVEGNAALSAGASIARLIGAAAGGFAIEFGGMATVAALDGATFLVGAVTAALLSERANVVAVESGKSADDDGDGDGGSEGGDGGDRSIRASIREIRSRPLLEAIIGIQPLAFFVYGGFPVLFIVFVTDELGRGGSAVGILRATSAVFALAAAAAITKFASGVAPSRLLAGGFLVFGIMAYSFVNMPAITTALWVYLVLYGGTGAPGTAVGVASQSILQQACPPEIMGRVGGLIGMLRNLAAGLGAVAAGVLVDVISSRALLNMQATIFMVCALFSYVFVMGRSVSNEVDLRPKKSQEIS